MNCCYHSKKKIIIITKTSQKLKSARIFLCIALLHNESLQTSVSKMISEAQDMPEILYQLKQQIQNREVLPRDIVCDYSCALIEAITFLFFQMLRSQY